MTSLTLKDMGLIVVSSSLLIVFHFIGLLPFVFILMVMTLLKKHVYWISIITSITLFIISSNQFWSLTNLIFLPFTAFVLFKSLQGVKPHVSVKKKRQAWMRHLRFSLLAFLLILVATASSQVLYELSIGVTIFSDLIQWVILTLTSFLNALLIFLIGRPLHLRFAKLLKYMHI